MSARACPSLALALLGAATLAQGAGPRPAATPKQATLRLGERIYREGILPSGDPVMAVVKGDIEVFGPMMSCESCHMRSGLGSIEGGVYSPPTHGPALFHPLKFIYKGVENPQLPPRRPAYTDESLADLLRYGYDPNTREMNDVMPRYELEDPDMALLIAYLHSLSSRESPGVTPTSLSLATVVTEGVNPAERDAMLTALTSYVAIKNKHAAYFETRGGVRSRRMAEGMFPSRELSTRRLSLARWVLKGPPATWRGQLESYYRQHPVFALVGGISTGEWKPVHQFSEDHRLPCLFPLTDFPVISASDWYTVYLSKGYYQEGEGVARYLHALDLKAGGTPILQVVRSSRAGRALSSGFLETWRDLGHEPPVTVTLKPGDKLTPELLRKSSGGSAAGTLILWDGADAVPAVGALAALADKPAMVFLSSSYLGKSMRSISEQARDFTYVAYPHRLPRDPKEKPKGGMGNRQFPPNPTRVDAQIEAIVQVLSMALMNMSGNYYRDNFLDAVDKTMDQEAVVLYERLSFGPGQRYASKGCYIVQLSKGEKPELVRKSDWVIH
jgi:Periplasmic binding protein